MSPSNTSLPRSHYQAFLFDMDGTVLNSIVPTERIWGAWAAKHGLNVEKFLPTMHGARAVDTIRNLGLPGVDAQAEATAINNAETVDLEGVVEIPGAAKFLKSLPLSRWAVVTSAPVSLAHARLKAAGLPLPATLISAEDVSAGKPNPEGYLVAAKRLKVDPARCLVFEDAPNGIHAGEASRAEVLVITATHRTQLTTKHPFVHTYENLVAQVDADGLLFLRG